MDGHDTDHGDPAAHLPDPSVWPLVAGLATLVAAAALVWWSRDRSSQIAGPILGAGLVSLLIAALGWAYEDGRMKKKKEEGGGPGARTPRYTQVVTFAIAEGELLRARTEGGVIPAIDSSDLRDLDGFQDLRIVVSPTDTGPSQVLVETTWSGREGLASYEETRQTLLDVVTGHSGEIVPGSVQVFDMEVVRDTKDTSFRFGLGAAFAVLGSLVVGGFMVGAGLSLFQEGNTGAGGTVTPGGPAGPDPYKVTATDNKFSAIALEAPPNTTVTFTFTNNGAAPHNLHFYTAKGGQTLATGAGAETPVQSKGTETLTFTTPGPGTYYFQCDFHPTEMFGTLTVREGAPPPGGAAAAPAGGGAPAAGAVTVVATDNKFDKTTLTGTAGQPFSVTLQNKGAALHNISFYDKQGGTTLTPGAQGGFLQGAKSETVTFTPPSAGTFYYQCDIHPSEMKGTFTVQ
ncbi:MAG: cupredoxin domain-containing protein [Chloroflexi bacterium]|nr:cupredoxin domain-containing protein [Chloroflexota bacterium]